MKKAYKGFNSDWKCRDFQYEIGKTYETKEDIEVCEKGFHCCENPIDVFNYYKDIKGKYAEVKILGKEKKGEDKTVTNKIKIVKELSFWDIYKLNIGIVVNVCLKSSKKSTSGDDSHANTSGNYSHANTSGNYSHANTSGNYSHANTSGDDSIACALGFSSRAKSLKSWIILVEYDDNYKIKNIRSGKVGVDIKSDVWYELKDNKFVEVE